MTDKRNNQQSELIFPTMGERLKVIRKELGVTRKQFTGRLNISETSYNQIENGTIKPDYDFLEKLVSEYNVNLYYLMFGQGEKLGGHCRTCPLKMPVKTFVDSKNLYDFLRYFGNSPLVQYFMMAQFLSLYRREKNVIEKEMRDAAAEEGQEQK